MWLSETVTCRVCYPDGGGKKGLASSQLDLPSGKEQWVMLKWEGNASEKGLLLKGSLEVFLFVFSVGVDLRKHSNPRRIFLKAPISMSS